MCPDRSRNAPDRRESCRTTRITPPCSTTNSRAVSPDGAVTNTGDESPDVTSCSAALSPGPGPGHGPLAVLPPHPAATARATVFFNDTATTEIYTLSLHDALPMSSPIVD